MNFVTLHNLNDPEHPIRPWRQGRWRIAREDSEWGLGENIALIGGKHLGESEPGYFVGIGQDYGPHGEAMTRANAILIHAAPVMYETLDSVAEGLRAALHQLQKGNVEAATTDVMAAREWCLDAMDKANPREEVQE